jgi:hypothetical protein
MQKKILSAFWMMLMMQMSFITNTGCYKDARIIGGMREEEISRGSTMEVYFVLKNP